MQKLSRLHEYLADRPRYQLQWLQKALNCRVEGKKSRHRDLMQAIEAHAAREGLTYVQAKAIIDHGEIIGYGRKE